MIFVCRGIPCGCPFRHTQKNAKGTEEENLCGAKPSQIKQRQGTWDTPFVRLMIWGSIVVTLVSGGFNDIVIHLLETHGVLVNWSSID